jgi:hypothetical protein
MMRKTELLALLCAITLGAAGCAGRHIVRAAPPSVSTPPPEETEPMPQPAAPPPAEVETTPPPEAIPPAPPLVPVNRPEPARPRPAPAESSEQTSKPAPPQISPQLSTRALEMAKNATNANISAAERNMQSANGRQLNAAQKDLTEKIRGFLAQAHEAIAAEDWVRAQNLAEKARVLSDELVKSF